MCLCEVKCFTLFSVNTNIEEVKLFSWNSLHMGTAVFQTSKLWRVFWTPLYWLCRVSVNTDYRLTWLSLMPPFFLSFSGQLGKTFEGHCPSACYTLVILSAGPWKDYLGSICKVTGGMICHFCLPRQRARIWVKSEHYVRPWWQSMSVTGAPYWVG